MLCCFTRIIPARVPAKNQLRSMAWPFFLEIHILPYGRSLTSMNGVNILVSFLCVFVRKIRIYIYVHIYAFMKLILNLSNLLDALANPVVIILLGQSYMESDRDIFWPKLSFRDDFDTVQNPTANSRFVYIMPTECLMRAQLDTVFCPIYKKEQDCSPFLTLADQTGRTQ